MAKALRTFFVVIGVLVFASCVMTCVSGVNMMKGVDTKITGESILFLQLKGVIIDGNDETNFLDNLRKYAREDAIKGVLIQIDSPGGVVGPSQEIHDAIKLVREELKKPVVISGNALMASGGYYAAVAGDKIVVNPGTLMGSIGVVLQFANLEKLYSWAKIKRYTITSGKFKDSGADYRSMREDERVLFQDLIDEVHKQFIQAVAVGRNLDVEKVKMYADGRIFTGETAVKIGFADQLGSLDVARKLIGEMTKLGSRPKLYKPPKRRPDFFEIISELESAETVKKIKQEMNLNLIGKPLFVFPGVL